VPLKQQQHQHHGAGHTATPTANVVVPGGAGAAAPSARKQLSYSWYAPVYSALEEELEQDSRVGVLLVYVFYIFQLAGF